MLSPVSPSATGKTLRSLTSCRRVASWVYAAWTTRRKRSMEVSAATRTGIIAPARLRGLDDLVGLQAAGAHVDAPSAAAIVDLHLLQVGIEAAPSGDHRVA